MLYHPPCRAERVDMLMDKEATRVILTAVDFAVSHRQKKTRQRDMQGKRDSNPKAVPALTFCGNNSTTQKDPEGTSSM